MLDAGQAATQLSNQKLKNITPVQCPVERKGSACKNEMNQTSRNPNFARNQNRLHGQPKKDPRTRHLLRNIQEARGKERRRSCLRLGGGCERSMSKNKSIESSMGAENACDPGSK